MEQTIKQAVDRYAELTKQAAAIKSELDDLRSVFETRATEDLKDTKLKTTEYWGSGNAKISVGNSETVKIVSNVMLRQLFGRVYDDFVRPKVSHELKVAAKTLLGDVFMGNYTEGNIDDIIAQLSDDEKTRKTLKKKLKGNFEKDKASIVMHTGIDEGAASDWAYLAKEVICWERLLQTLKAANWQGGTQDAVDHIRAAVMVDEGIKVTFDAEN